ncbi:MAG: MarR family transcriptional regulator [Alphaproteobacteria bacterium]|jgi:MarR family transcriptional regulator, transcriptional regulator for hemolysin|nr:MarR family transcriptional regulator [Alphaproteobacteria bacterium]MBT4082735.1 MarR family transcriptional regulator [Alphaproteobacteria bacterium]MBT4543964.1 MarR family transcriptional regulator [Alphaproteobacteria bacterium]MBT6387753.1 MarR family transcriptional regulator [Alphaproteobacteria bacterium]MBT7745151.1 MarR family transcriptional regulator [Alphaproteobacteria bacterium]
MKIRERKLGLLFSDIARFRGIMFDQMLAEDGLTHVQAFALNHLHNRNGLTQTELAERMDVGTVTVSGLVDRLEAKGWVERRIDEKDQRAKRIWLTSKVGGIRQKMFDGIDQVNDVAFEGLSDDEVDQFIDMLKNAKVKLSDKLEDMGRKTLPPD